MNGIGNGTLTTNPTEFAKVEKVSKESLDPAEKLRPACHSQDTVNFHFYFVCTAHHVQNTLVFE